MTTFTMQDLTPEQQQALTKHEEMHKMFQDMGKDLGVNAFETPVFSITPLNATEPQPTCGQPVHTPTPDIESIINTICTQLQLLSSVISQSKAQPEGAQGNSLQECVSLTLQQADWFKDLVRRELIGGGIEDLAKDAVQEVVENEVESYFENNFDPSYHFDFDDAVHDAVGDRIDDVVSDKIDDALDSYMSNATITITK